MQEARLVLTDLDLPSIQVPGARYTTVRFAQPGVIRDPQEFSFVPTEGTWEYAILVSPRGLPWILAEFTTSAPNPESKGETIQAKAVLQVSLRTGRYDVSLYDPSLNDRESDEYVSIGIATVELDVPFHVPSYMQQLEGAMQELRSLAKSERDASFEEWVTAFQGSIINDAVKWYYLQQYTTKARDLITPAYYFVELVRIVPAASDAFVRRLYRAVAEIHGTTVEEIEGHLQTDPNLVSDATFLMLHRVLGDLLTLPANAHYYVSDHAGLEEVERFSMGCYEGMLTGDCEDLALVEMLTYYSFLKNRNLPPGLRKLMEGFKPMLITGAATNRKLEDLTIMRDGFICHVWSFFIPKHQVLRWKGQTVRGLDMKFQQRLFPVIAEGTNFADPLSMEIPYYINDDPQEAAAEIARVRKRLLNIAELSQLNPALDGKVQIRFAPLDRELRDPDKLSTFYCYSISAAMVADSDSEDEPLLWNFTRDRKVGVKPYHILRMDPNIALKPHIKRHALTREQRAILVSFNGTPLQLVAGDAPIVVAQSGTIDRDNMAEFRFKSMNDLANTEPWRGQKNFKLIRVSITRQLQVFVLQITP